LDTKVTVKKGLVIFESSLHGSDICELFEDFNQEVYENHLEKIDYGIWKTFKKFSQSKSSIHVEVKFDTLWDREFVTTIFDDKDAFTVVEGDESLGDFITAWVAAPIVRGYCRDKKLPFLNTNGVLFTDKELVDEIKDYIENYASPKEIIKELEDGDGSLTYKVIEPSRYNIDIPKFHQEFYCTSTTATTSTGTSLNEAISNCMKEIDNLKLDLAFKEDKKTEINNTKEKNNMNSMFNFDFGPVNSNSVRMSMYGLAVKNKDSKYVSYNASTDEIFDVEIFNFDGAKFLYKMPVAIKDIAIGDVVVHNHAPMFVVAIPKDGKSLKVVDPINGEKKEIMLTKSPFGFNFATKIVNFLAGAFNAAEVSESNPFGNMWMFALMGENKNMNDILPLMMMSNGGNMNLQMMLPLMLMGDSKSSAKDILPMMMFMNMNGCGCTDSKTGGAGSGN
jgi:hypothetical protein